MSALLTDFKAQATARLDENTEKIQKALTHISDEEVWQRPNAQSNSIANLILHLCGNITQYVISGLGGEPDTRERDQEFDAKTGLSKQELLEKLRQVVDQAKTNILEASDEVYETKKEVQCYHYSGLAMVFHAVEHYSYHTGQIAFYVKALKSKDLGFYDGMEL
jgi:uncharacterized damage-inducible protein DinB